MNATVRIAAAVVAVVLSAGPALADTAAPNTLLWDCSRAGAPSLAEVKQLFDEANNHYASQLRVRLQMRLRAECQEGARRVLFALKGPVQSKEVFAALVVPSSGL